MSSVIVYKKSGEEKPQKLVGKTGKRRVLVTGASGNIGKYLSEQWKDQYDLICHLHSDKKVDQVKDFGDVEVVEVEKDLEGMKRICAGVDTVIHLAGAPRPDTTFSVAMDSNMKGTYNTFVAAKSCNVRRVIYASSIHAVSGYSKFRSVRPEDPVNPGDIYGVSKCFSEALARYFAEQEGLPAICIRIGAFQPPDDCHSEKDSLWMANCWVSPRDLKQLMERCIEDEKLQFGIFNGVSENRFNFLDTESNKAILGYQPQDDFFQEHPSLKNYKFHETVPAHNKNEMHYEDGAREELKQEKA